MTDYYGSEDSFEEEETVTPDGMSFGVTAVMPSSVRDISATYRAALERLKAERRGMSRGEKIDALLFGLGQPVRRGGNWKDAVANAAQALSQQSLKAKERDRARDELIAKYEIDLPYKSAMAEAALTKANAAAKPKIASDANERLRLGLVRRLFPGVTDEEIIARNLLYDPKVNNALLREKAIIATAQGMGSSGDVPESIISEVQSTIVQPPSWEAWYAEARKAPQNQGLTDAQLREFYDRKYRGR